MTHNLDTLLGIADDLRQDGAVPTRVALSDLPPRVASAQKAVAGGARLATLRYLLDHPSSPRAAVVAALGISPGAARAALDELEELGYVTADVEPQQRAGRLVRYCVDRARLTDDLTSFVSWVLR